jgi:hypothetical protein
LKTRARGRIPKPEERKPYRVEIGSASREGTATEK